MKVRIIGHSGHPQVPYWYVHRIGEVFEVAQEGGRYLHVDIDDKLYLIERRDVEFLEGGEDEWRPSDNGLLI